MVAGRVSTHALSMQCDVGNTVQPRYLVCTLSQRNSQRCRHACCHSLCALDHGVLAFAGCKEACNQGTRRRLRTTRASNAAHMGDARSAGAPDSLAPGPLDGASAAAPPAGSGVSPAPSGSAPSAGAPAAPGPTAGRGGRVVLAPDGGRGPPGTAGDARGTGRWPSRGGFLRLEPSHPLLV